jgi:NAD(P)-dependent dehydrogenase (short-subunit alcohol dehydrogenase family)
MSVDKIPFSLKGKFIIVTGASSGIGRECAFACSQMGATVALFGRDIPRLEEALSLMKEPGNHIICPVDLTDYEKIADVIKEIVSQRGRLDGLINCAGISTTLPLNAVSPAKMNEFFETNVIGSINLSRQVVKASHFSESGGSVVFISSVMGSVGEIGKTLYSMTKGALTAAVKSMALELAPKKIRVNAVSPGVVVTPMSGKAIYSRDEESLNKIKSLHPLGLGEPKDVADACVFLLSDEARWITGTNLIVDGGYLAR